MVTQIHFNRIWFQLDQSFRTVIDLLNPSLTLTIHPRTEEKKNVRCTLIGSFFHFGWVFECSKFSILHPINNRCFPCSDSPSLLLSFCQWLLEKSVFDCPFPDACFSASSQNQVLSSFFFLGLKINMGKKSWKIAIFPSLSFFFFFEGKQKIGFKTSILELNFGWPIDVPDSFNQIYFHQWKAIVQIRAPLWLVFIVDRSFWAQVETWVYW